MKKLAYKILGTVLLVGLVIAGCGQSDGGADKTPGSIGEQMGYEIIGIDPGAGIMEATRDALEQYELEQWGLVDSSESAMMAALRRAYSNQEPIVITGWTPHWKFYSFDLKYLEDPLNIYGGDEQIHTIVRKGLETDHPSAYQVLERFYWEPADMEQVMTMIEDGMSESDASNTWIEENRAEVDKWLDGVEPVDGESLSLAYVAWATEIASTNVVAAVLESIGYDVTLQQLEAGGMFTGVASGGSDALVAAWLPTTHEAFYERYKDDFVDLGVNLDGTRIGLVVPAYMDIDSIEDLK